MRRQRKVLIGINAGLLMAAGAVHWAASPGLAQDDNRSRGSYMLIGGEIQGGDANAIYVLDTINEELIAVRWNHSRRELEQLGYRDVRRDTSQEAGR